MNHFCNDCGKIFKKRDMIKTNISCLYKLDGEYFLRACCPNCFSWNFDKMDSYKPVLEVD